MLQVIESLDEAKSAPVKDTGEGQAKAKYDFDAASPNELTLKKVMSTFFAHSTAI